MFPKICQIANCVYKKLKLNQKCKVNVCTNPFLVNKYKKICNFKYSEINDNETKTY